MGLLPSGVPSLVSHHWCPIAVVPTSVSQGRTQGAALASFLSMPSPSLQALVASSTPQVLRTSLPPWSLMHIWAELRYLMAGTSQRHGDAGWEGPCAWPPEVAPGSVPP